jgi:hypothetical protein
LGWGGERGDLKNIQKAFRDILAELSLPQSKLLLLSAALFAFEWNLINNHFLNILTSTFVCIALVWNAISSMKRSDLSLGTKLSNNAVTLLVLGVTLAYIFVSFGDSVSVSLLAPSSIFVAIGAVFGQYIGASLGKLLRSKDLPRIILYYLFLAVLIIWVSAFLFSIADGGRGFVITSEKIAVVDFFYFSAMNFYSSSLGEYVPVGAMTKILAVLEVVVSFVIHIIILGAVLGVYSKK